MPGYNSARVSTIRPFALACVFVTASLIPALDYGFGPGNETLTARRDVHRAILDHTARTPDRYRWLSAAIIEVPTRALATVMPYERAYDRASFVFYLAAITGMLWSLFAWLRRWFGDEPALIASLIAACTLRITMRYHDYAPASFLEPTFVALALLAILNRRYGWLGALIGIATFNRETAIFLVLLSLVTSHRTREDWLRAAGYAAIWATVYGLVRWVSGDAERYWTPELVWRTNLSQPILAVSSLTLLLGAFWAFAALGGKHAPPFVRQAAWIVPPYLVTVAIWGIWWEVRLLMPLYPIVFAFALAYLTRAEWPAWTLAAIFVTAIAVNAFDYSVLVPQPQSRYEMHQAIVEGTAPAPQRFRVLVPWLLDPIVNVAARFTDPQQAFRRVYLLFHVAALTTLVAGIYAYSRLWFSRTQALIAALIVGSTLRLVLRMGEYWDFSPIPERTWFAPWSLLEPALIAAGLLLLARQQVALVAILTIVGALNSEASLLLPLFALMLPNQKRRDGIALLALWMVVTALVRLGVGGFVVPSPPFTENLANLPHVIINLMLFLGPALLLALAGFTRAPAFAQRGVIAVVPLLLAVVVYGYWWDVRLLTPIYPLLAPLLLAGLFPTHQQA